MTEKASQAFKDFMDAQETLRLWYKEHPGKDPPGWMKEALRKAQKRYEEQKQHA